VRRRIVLDTDLGSDVDDALCLALGLASPELEIVAITSVGRESRTRARLTRKLLELAGRAEIPVHAGCRVPLLGGRGFNWFGTELEALEPGEELPISDEHGVNAIGRLFYEQDDLELVAIGPLTNVAVALIKDPDLAGRVRRLTVMGGHIRKASYGGHTFEPGLDYNLCSDPHASLVALGAGIPTQLVTADVTLQTWLTHIDLARLEAAGSALHAWLARSIRLWTPTQKRIFSAAGCDVDDDNVAFLHDPLTLASLSDESFLSFETLEIEPRIERGIFRTVECAEPSSDSLPMRCAVSVDARAARAHCIERILSLASSAR
jgi:purine nucleosidase